MWGVLAPTAAIHACTALATNSGPLSERMWPGTPRTMKRSDSTSMTSVEPSLRATRIARHSWVNSSITFSMRYFRPSLRGPSALGALRRIARCRRAMGAVLDEVVGPDVVRTLGPQPEARPVRQPEPAELALRRAVLAERCAGTALGQLQLAADMLDAGAATRGAQ